MIAELHFWATLIIPLIATALVGLFLTKKVHDVHLSLNSRLDQFLEQPQLGGQIGFDGWMIIKMIARQIGEGRGRDAQAVEPILIETVRRGFDREMRRLTFCLCGMATP